MAATNKILAKRFDELTEALTKAHDGMREAIASGDIDVLEETCDHIGDLIAPEDTNESSDDEELDEEDEDLDDDETEE